MANKPSNKKTIKVEETVIVEESPNVAVKRILKSKTIWVNLIAFLCFALEKRYGFLIDPDLQLQILSLINIGLRFVTKEAIVWDGERKTEDA